MINIKKNFEYNESFIKNLDYKEKTFDDNKQDFIEFYKKKQKEATEGQKLCDQILHNIIDDGVISKDELPMEISSKTNDIIIDQKSGINSETINVDSTNPTTNSTITTSNSVKTASNLVKTTPTPVKTTSNPAKTTSNQSKQHQLR